MLEIVTGAGVVGTPVRALQVSMFSSATLMGLIGAALALHHWLADYSRPRRALGFLVAGELLLFALFTLLAMMRPEELL